jgi:hypothetical protein
MPFVIATEMRPTISGGSANPTGTPVKWYYLGNRRWTKDLGRAQRFDAEDAAWQLVLLKDTLKNMKFTFIVVDLLPLAAEASAMDPAELDRLRILARDFKKLLSEGYQFMELPAPHEPRIFKIGEKQCQCAHCVERVIGLFPDLQ